MNSTHCHALNLNLVIKDTVQCCISVKGLIEILKQTIIFFHDSYKRASVWSEKVRGSEIGSDKFKKF